MRTRMAWIACLVVPVVCGLAALSLTRGQEQPGTPPPPAPAPAPPESARDLSKLPPLQQQMNVSAQSGADWLFRVNTVNGRFLPGYEPSLAVPLEGDHFLRQAGAAFALARAARFTGEERYAARATQALLSLLEETVADADDRQARHTALPSSALNRLASAGLLIAAVHELPAPKDDLLDQAEQLGNFVRKRQQTDGSFAVHDGPDDAKAAGPEALGYPGLALYGLLRSQRHRPADWKAEAARRALPYYRGRWKEHKEHEFVPWQAAAAAEAFLQTKEPAFADFVYEMSDWLCRLQYDRPDVRRPLWYGGFKGWHGGKAVEEAPTVASAAYAGALAEACRVAREKADVTNYQRYREATERGLQFLATLQYTDANTQHFADWYRPRLLGAFHPSHQDGNLRLDYTQHAVCALVQYLAHVAK